MTQHKKMFIVKTEKIFQVAHTHLIYYTFLTLWRVSFQSKKDKFWKDKQKTDGNYQSLKLLK